MSNCIIIEDQAPAQRILAKYIEMSPSLQLVGTFNNALDANEALLWQNIDLIFLDIHLPKISGIDFLKSLNEPPKIILTTAFSEYAVQSYELSVVDYLLKPFSYERFEKAIAKYHALYAENTQIEAESASEIFVKSGYEFIKINCDEIVFIKSDMDYTELHFDDRKILTQETLQSWEAKLPAKHFFRIHKSFIVNTRRIEKVAGGMVYYNADLSIPIGRAYKDDFFSKFVKA